MVSPVVLTLLANNDRMRWEEACRHSGQVAGASASGAGRKVSNDRWQEVQKYSYSGIVSSLSRASRARHDCHQRIGIGQ